MNPFITRDRQHYRRWLNVLPGFLIPGSAQFLSGRKKAGLAWFLVTLVLYCVLAALLLTPESSYSYGTNGVHWFDLVTLAVMIGLIVDACRRPIPRIGVKGWAVFLAAFVMITLAPALAFRAFVVEPFRITSTSMAPTIIWRKANADRILASKFQYRLHPPEQWDVVVFKIDRARMDYHQGLYRGKELPQGIRIGPNGTITRNSGGTAAAPDSPEYVDYIKRLIGLPGQEIQVIAGDIFIDGKIARKPPQVEESMLVPVTDDDRLSRSGETFFDRWHKEHGAAAISMEGAVITLAGSAMECNVKYSLLIQDHIPTSVRSRQLRPRSLNTVGDVKLSFLLTRTGGTGNLICRLSRDDVEYTFVLPLGKPGEVARIFDGGNTVAQAGAPFNPTGEHLIEVSNIDARAVLRVDGDVLTLFESDNPGPPAGRTITERTGVAFGVTGCDVAVRDVRLRRDIYYDDSAVRARFAVQKPYKLNEGEYFVIGDNSANSFDSRHWGVVKRANITGKVFYVFAPADRKRWIK